jgi:MFS family permease
MQIFILALYAAVYPALLAAVGILLASPRRTRLLTAFLVAGMAMSVGCGIGIVLLIHGSGAVSHQGSGWSWGTDVAVGVLALLVALALATHGWRRLRARRAGPEPAERRDPWTQRLLGRGSVPIVVVASIVLNLPGAVYLVALKDIAAGHHSAPVDLALVVGFNVIMFALAEIPWVGLMVAPERTDRLVKRAMEFLGVHGTKLATALCLVVGVHLIVRGLIRS